MPPTTQSARQSSGDQTSQISPPQTSPSTPVQATNPTTDSIPTGPVIPPPAISPVSAVSPSGGIVGAGGVGTLNLITPSESSTLNEATFNPVAFALFGEFAFNAGLVYDPYLPWLTIQVSRDELLL